MSLVEQLLRAGDRLSICWLGNDGWLLAHGGHIVATDLDLFLGERMLPRLNELPELAEHLEYLFVTHAHTDHFNPQTIRMLLERGPCKLVLAESCRSAALEYGLDAERIRYAKPGLAPLDLHRNPLPLPRAGGTVPGLPGWLRAEAIRALHGHSGGSVYEGASGEDCGYVFHFGGKTTVQPGDSVLLQEHLELADIDLLLVSPTEHNMGIEKAKYLIEKVRPGRIFAQHFGTYRESAGNAFWTHGFQEELFLSLSPGLRERFTVPVYREIYVL